MGSVKCSTMPHQQISGANIITVFNSPIQRSHFARRENVSGKINMIGFDNRAHFCQ